MTLVGLDVAGVDLLESSTGPKVMEVNSSPGFEGLEKAYANGELHPKDLKAGVNDGLNRELGPVRKYFETHSEHLEALQRILQSG